MVTDQQIRRLCKLSNTEETQEIAAAKAGMDVKTARKYLRARRLPSEMRAERHWRTRQDEFRGGMAGDPERSWRTNPGLEAKTVFAALQRQYPETVRGGTVANLAAPGQAMASDGRSSAGSVLRAGASCRGVVRVGFHPPDGAGDHHRRASRFRTCCTTSC